ncbi:MAG: macro domain-containing protein [Moraxellaceae bacterium]|nr:macro domain-containing protein [Moraxellaceae bacterium]
MSDMLFAVRDDIAKIAANAIVRVSNSKQGDAILAAGGQKLCKAAAKLGTPNVGQVFITQGFDLPCDYVIHTTWPVWRGGQYFESDLLGASYRNVLHLAASQGIKTLAFSAFRQMQFLHPYTRMIAMEEVTNYFNEPTGTLEQVIFCVDDDEEQRLYEEAFCRFHLRTVYMSGEVDIRKGEMDDFVRLVQENWGASADELNQLLKEKRDELG